MRVLATGLIALLVVTITATGPAFAQPAEITVEDCIAFDINDDGAFCCYVFTLCIQNNSLPPINDLHIQLLDSNLCADPAAPGGWEVVAADPVSAEWEAFPGSEIQAGSGLCGFQISSRSRTTEFRITLTVDGTPVFQTDTSFTCVRDCVVPVEPGTWGRIKSLYTAD